MIRTDRRQVPSPLDPGIVSRANSRIDQWFKIEPEERHRQKPDFPERLSIGEQAQEALGKLFIGKCAYCESPLGADSPGEVDWFRPFTEANDLSGTGSADHYIWLFASWENLYLSCPSCARSKRSLFPVDGARAQPLTPQAEIQKSERALLIDPCHDEPAEHLRFFETGMVQPLSKMGESTIKVLNLNRSDLLRARSEVWQQTWLAARSLGENDVSISLDRGRPYAAVARAALTAIRREIRPIPVGDYVVRPVTPELRTAEEILAHDAEAFRLTARPLRRVKIENFRALRKVEFTFDEPSGRHTPWLLLLGENATGKSTVLQAIALTLAGADEAQKHVRASQLPSDGTFEGSVQIWFWDQDAPAELRFRRRSDQFDGTRGASAIVLGYGALRYAERRSRTFDVGLSLSQIAPLMEPISRIRYPGQWLLNLSEAQFDTAARALQSVLPSAKETHREMGDVRSPEDDAMMRSIMRRSGSRIYFDDGHHRANIAQLSAGYQTIVGMCGDIMRLLFERWDTLSSAIAIVLIDELDAHLHPSWAMRIVNAFRQAFPQVQFLASTHDPLVLRGLRNGEVALLRRNEGDEIVVDQNLPPLEGMQVDQILTSRVFGLDSTVDPETEALLDEFYHLRSLPPDRMREARMSEIRARVGDRESLGRSESERLMLQAAAQFVRDTSQSPDARVELRAETLARLREIAARGANARRGRQ